VTVTPTIQDGTVVRWYDSEHWLMMGEPSFSASRRRVRIGLRDIATTAQRNRLVAAIDAAMEVQGRILNGEDVRHLATWERDGLTGPHRPIEPVVSGSIPISSERR
jgi:hypothetical protein